jgi:hypothetical protein
VEAVRKAVTLTSRGQCLVSNSGLGELGGDPITAQESAEGIVNAYYHRSLPKGVAEQVQRAILKISLPLLTDESVVLDAGYML